MSLTLARVEFFDTNLTRRIEWNSSELGISLQSSKLTYFGSEFQLTTATATASQQLCPSGKAPGASRTGSKYPVQESLTSRDINVKPGQPD